MIGPFLGGIGLITTAFLAILTYFLIHRRTTETSWIESFRILYGEFWKDNDVTQVRRWITNDEEYKVIEKILEKRMKATKNNDLSEEDNNNLEKLDRFCSVMMRIRYFGQMKMSQSQRELYKDTYETFWKEKINRRDLLKKYINEYWPGLSTWLHSKNNNAGNRSGYNIDDR